jgi:hypothetical protein
MRRRYARRMRAGCRGNDRRRVHDHPFRRWNRHAAVTRCIISCRLSKANCCAHRRSRMWAQNSGSPSTRYARSGSDRLIHRLRHCSCAILMCLVASLLPTPRLPECRNSQTRSCSSRLTSMKWIPLPKIRAGAASWVRSAERSRRCRSSCCTCRRTAGWPSRWTAAGWTDRRDGEGRGGQARCAGHACRSRCRLRPRPG